MAAQLEGFNYVIKIQLSFNKMIETQVAQLASSCPNVNTGKLPGQPEVPSKENVSAVTTQEPPFTKDVGKQRKTVTASRTEAEDEEEEEADDTNAPATQEDPMEPPRTSRDYHDTTALPFLEWIRKPVATNNSANSSR